MINFTVGPVQATEDIRKIGYEQVPYFRTQEFSKIMLENENLMKKFTRSSEDARAVFITGSGTASMEASVVNTLSNSDKVLVVNGGSFGSRFVELLKIHNINYDEIKLDYGKTLTKETLEQYDATKYTAFLVNLHETSTGVLYDLDLIHNFCIKNNLFLIVDAISAFLADDIDMKKQGVDVLITGSQKALACPPGISIIVLSPRAIDRINNIDCGCMYLNLKSTLLNQERGQTPFTPAVGILRQINKRLNTIDENGGVASEINHVAQLANDFRSKISDFPFEIASESLSNAVTPIRVLNNKAYEIFLTLKDEYGIWICPNGGDLKDSIFRVGHIGALTMEDNDKLISALSDMKRRGLL